MKLKGIADINEMSAHVHIGNPKWVSEHGIGSGRDLINVVLADWDLRSRDALVMSIMHTAGEMCPKDDDDEGFVLITCILLGIQLGRTMGRMREETPEPGKGDSDGETLI